MTFVDSTVLGIVEGISEFLPISSTGHLILVSHLLHIEQSSFQKSFEIIIQLGAIASVVVLYFKSFFNVEILKKLFVAFLPTGIIGLLLYKIIKTYLIGNEMVVLWALLLGGVALIVFELLHKEKEDAAQSITEVSYTQAALIGLFQSLAIIPGVSRSAASIVGGLLLGLKRSTIVEFSFLLAVPTMLAATGLDLAKNASLFSMDQFGILTIGFVTSFVVALVSIKFLLSYIRSHTFIPFGIYRIVIAILFFLFVVSR
jgi:undecaprenyl-diphosphatase